MWRHSLLNNIGQVPQLNTTQLWLGRTPKFLDGLNYESKGEDIGRRRNCGVLPGSQHFGGRRACWSSEMRLGKATSDLTIHANLHNLNKKLVSVKLEHFWCTDESRANTDPQDSPRLGLGGSHHLPPYSILYAWPQDQHPNDILSRDPQVRVLKFPKLRLWRL
jgi:hypothetical protein